MACPSTRFLSFARAYFSEEYRSSNIVDVPDDQGLLHSGQIVDKTDDGLLVDFFSKGQLPRLIGYGKLFSWDWEQDINDPVDLSLKIQVLSRLSHDGPLAWYPAECLDAGTNLDSSELVRLDIEFEGAVVQEIVHTSQIRNVPIDMEKRTVDQNSFRTGSCRLSDYYASSLTNASPLWKMLYRELQRSKGAHAIGIRNGHAEYLDQGKIEPDSLEDDLNWTAERMESCLKKGLVWDSRCFTRPPVTVLPDDSLSSVPFRWLPVGVLVEIFQHLESVDRVWFRRVSPTWNSILSLVTLFKDVWVAPKYRYDCPFKWSAWDTLHAVVLAVTKLVTKTTKWVIIVGSSDNTREPTEEDQHVNDALLGLISDLGRYFSLPSLGKLNFVISQFRWSLGGLTALQEGVEKMANLCASCTPVCDVLIWKDCTFVQHDSFKTAVLPIRKALVKVASPALKADLWEMLNLDAPETNLEELSQWLAHGTGTDEVGSFVCVFHAGDPGITAQSTLYHAEELEGMFVNELDVRRLNRLTQWILSVEMAKKIPRGTKRPLEESSSSDEVHALGCKRARSDE